MIVTEEVDSVVRQTSTPCHENAKTFNSSELNLSGAQNLHQSHHYHHQHHLHSNSSHHSFTSQKIITQVDVQLEAEIKAKERYLQDLQSIDLAKFGFANEGKPRTDYTYANTALYRTINDHKDNYEVPNLMRRARKISPQNSINHSLNENHCHTSENEAIAVSNSSVYKTKRVVKKASKSFKSWFLGLLGFFWLFFKWIIFFPLVIIGFCYMGTWLFNNLKVQSLNNCMQNWFQNDNSDYNHMYIKHEVVGSIERFRDNIMKEVTENLHQASMPSIEHVRNEFDEKFNKTLALLIGKFSDQSVSLEAAKTNCNQELLQLKETIKNLESKYISLTESALHSKGRDTQPTQLAIEEIIKKTLYIYNADKTGMTDYASESLGASVMFTKCTETYMEKPQWLTIMNIPIYRISKSPRVIIQHDIHPGNCWAFSGSKGDVFIKLADTVYPTSFSLEHIPKELTPTGSLSSAPQNFSVYGYQDSGKVDTNEGILLGSYRYDNASNEIIQFFNVQTENKEPIEIIELKIESNAGNKDYTCVYKFRVHGKQLMESQPAN